MKRSSGDETQRPKSIMTRRDFLALPLFLFGAGLVGDLPPGVVAGLKKRLRKRAMGADAGERDGESSRIEVLCERHLTGPHDLVG